MLKPIVRILEDFWQVFIQMKEFVKYSGSAGILKVIIKEYRINTNTLLLFLP